MKKLWILFFLSAISSTIFGQQYDLIVAKDGTGQYSSIQEAVNAIRDYKPEGRQRILVKKGVYEEKVIIPSYKTNITLIGEDQDSTILVWHDHANMRTATGWPAFSTEEENRAQEEGLQKQGRKIGTFQSYTLRVDGLGFECENMTISNDAMSHWNKDWHQTRSNAQGIGQAVAVHIEADRVVFRHCRLLGFQDTVFNGNEDSRQIFYQCYIEGTVDFIFGPATCWFEECHIHALTDGYLTAASTPADHPYGYIFYQCKVTADPKVNGTYLGRPWRNWASVIFYQCELPEAIRPQGWHNWKDPVREKTARYYEYQCTGAGAEASQRVSWRRSLSEDEANTLSVEKVMNHQFSPWKPNYRPVSIQQVLPSFYNIENKEGASYIGGTLEPKELPVDPIKNTEPLVINLQEVDCTTFVEYVSAAILGHVTTPTPNDSILKRFVQALRYRQGIRGNYATRKHYFSEWISDNEAQGLLTEITSTLPMAKKTKRTIDFMSTHSNLYPQLAVSPTLVEEIRKVEAELSQREIWMIPKSQIHKTYSNLQHGDIVVLSTDKKGLDVFHCGFVWWPDRQGEPQLLHASSVGKQVVLSGKSLEEYAQSVSICSGLRILRLNAQ